MSAGLLVFFNAIPKQMKGMVISKSPEYTAAKTPCNGKHPPLSATDGAKQKPSLAKGENDCKCDQRRDGGNQKQFVIRKAR